jgi:trans-2,3-dihydro-3-hydroxyanthranilate isomerase
MTDIAATLRFDVVDVFADQPFTGNPLAVVHGADALRTEQLQAIAREFNLSETVFPMAPTAVGADYRVRIFTPEEELPFAGHPSVGVAWVLARDGVIGIGDAVQECKVGMLAVRVDHASARIAGGPARLGPELDAAELAAVVGLTSEDVDPIAPAGVAGAGFDFPILLVHPAAVGRAVTPDVQAVRAATQQGGVLIAAVDLAARRVHARMFAPGMGIAEDPATGSAAVALAVYLVHYGLLPADGDAAFTVFQGAEIQRPSRLDVELTASAGVVTRTSVGGRVVAVSSGQILVPPSHQPV